MQYWDLPECSVCHDKLSHSLCVLSHCGHVYHNQCISRWLSSTTSGNKNNCPLCRKTITKNVITPLKYETFAKNIGDTTDQQINFLQGEIKNLRAKIISTNNENISLNLAMESLNNENSALTSKLEDSFEKNTELNRKIKEFELEINSLNATNKRLSELIEDYKSKIAKNEESTKYIKSVTEKEGDVLTNLSKDEKINVLLQRVVYLSKSITELSKLRDKWKRSYNELNKSYSELQGDYLNLATTNPSPENSNDTLINFKRYKSSSEVSSSKTRKLNDYPQIRIPNNILTSRKSNTANTLAEKQKIIQHIKAMKPIKIQKEIKHFFNPV